MLRSSRPVTVSRRSTGVPSARLAVIFSIRCSPPEQRRLVSSAVITAGQSMTATGCPPLIPGWTVMNRLVKSGRCSQGWAMRRSAAAVRQRLAPDQGRVAEPLELGILLVGGALLGCARGADVGHARWRLLSLSGRRRSRRAVPHEYQLGRRLRVSSAGAGMLVRSGRTTGSMPEGWRIGLPSARSRKPDRSERAVFHADQQVAPVLAVTQTNHVSRQPCPPACVARRGPCTLVIDPRLRPKSQQIANKLVTVGGCVRIHDPSTYPVGPTSSARRQDPGSDGTVHRSTGTGQPSDA
jgi:hypothetical protein